jgi:hypothetical protein
LQRGRVGGLGLGQVVHALLEDVLGVGLLQRKLVALGGELFALNEGSDRRRWHWWTGGWQLGLGCLEQGLRRDIGLGNLPAPADTGPWSRYTRLRGADILRAGFVLQLLIIGLGLLQIGLNLLDLQLEAAASAGPVAGRPALLAGTRISVTVPLAAKRRSAWAWAATLPVALTAASIVPVFAVAVVQPGVSLAAAPVAPRNISSAPTTPITITATTIPITHLRLTRARLRGGHIDMVHAPQV